MVHAPVKIMISSIRMQINGFPGKFLGAAVFQCLLYRDETTGNRILINPRRLSIDPCFVVRIRDCLNEEYKVPLKLHIRQFRT